MLDCLFPKKLFFFELFEQHVQINLEAVQKLLTCISSGMDPSWISSIKSLEHQADTITKKVTEAVHMIFITPFDRDQIHDLMSKMDDIMDCIDATTDSILIYKIQNTDPFLYELVQLLQKAIIQVSHAVKGLRDLNNGKNIKEACQEINRIEHEADAVLRQAVGQLFDENKDAIHIMKYKELYENVEQAVDRCDDVGDLIIGILLENT
jgi:uncharacterized protein